MEEQQAPDGSTKVYFLDGSCKLFDVLPSTTVGTLLTDVKSRLGLAATNAFALYQVQRGTHYLLHENGSRAEFLSACALARALRPKCAATG